MWVLERRCILSTFELKFQELLKRFHMINGGTIDDTMMLHYKSQRVLQEFMKYLREEMLKISEAYLLG